MRGWGSIKLGELVNLTTGAPFKSSAFGDCGIPVLKIKNVKANRLLLDDVDHISEEVAKEYPESFLQKGDLLITMTGNRIGGGMDSWVGKVARFNEDRQYCLNQRIGIIRPKSPHAVDVRFLSFCLSTGDSQRELIQIATGSGGQANLSPKQILAVKVPHPPLTVQRAIASVLGALDEKIKVNRRINETLEALAQSLFKSWFVDPTQSALPKGWVIGKLSDIADIVMGLSPNGDTYNSNGVGVPLINGPVEFGDYFPVKSKWTTLPARIAQADDLIFCVRGSTTGRRVVSDDNYCLGRGVCGIRARNGANTFLHQTVNFGLENLLTKTTGSVFPSLSAPDIKGLPIVLPPAEVITRFSEKAEPLTKMIQENVNESRTLAALRDALLPKLLSGELRVPAAKP
jgi:type I restriction enzyme S subunit